MIFDTQQLTNGRLQQATEFQAHIAGHLTAVYQSIMAAERERIDARAPLGDYTNIAADVVEDIQKLVLSSEWARQVDSEEWADAALAVLQSHISTIQQLEQRWHSAERV